MIDTPHRLRVASYNIFKAKFFETPGRRGGTVLEDFTQLDSLRRADVLALQEAFVGPLRPGGPDRDTVGELAARLEFGGGSDGHRRFHGVPYGCGRWGVGLLTRPAARFETLDLPRPFWSPWQRGAILARFGPWIVGTLHLEVWPIGAPARRQQIVTILRAVDRMRDGGRTPVVLAGDFNCQGGGPHEELERAGFTPALRDGVATYAIAGLGLRLDNIYVRDAEVLAAGVERGARGSDHWPVWADVEA